MTHIRCNNKVTNIFIIIMKLLFICEYKSPPSKYFSLCILYTCTVFPIIKTLMVCTLGCSPLIGQAVFFLSSVRLKITFFKVIFLLGNEKKSQEAISGELFHQKYRFSRLLLKIYEFKVKHKRP